MGIFDFLKRDRDYEREEATKGVLDPYLPENPEIVRAGRYEVNVEEFYASLSDEERKLYGIRSGNPNYLVPLLDPAIARDNGFRLHLAHSIESNKKNIETAVRTKLIKGEKVEGLLRVLASS